MLFKPIQEYAVLIETGLSGVDQAASACLRFKRQLEALTHPGIEEIVVGANSLLVLLDEDGAGANSMIHTLEAALKTIPSDAGLDPLREARTHRIPVHYDGADLAEVAVQARLSVDEIVSLHSGAVYTVAFHGFAPGFSYLSGLPARLRMPRLSSPRTLVPAGSVAIAAEFSGIYPLAGPGGWHLLGSCSVSLFDPTRDPPALFAPGDRVKFEAV